MVRHCAQSPRARQRASKARARARVHLDEVCVPQRREQPDLLQEGVARVTGDQPRLEPLRRHLAFGALMPYVPDLAIVAGADPAHPHNLGLVDAQQHERLRAHELRLGSAQEGQAFDGRLAGHVRRRRRRRRARRRVGPVRVRPANAVCRPSARAAALPLVRRIGPARGAQRGDSGRRARLAQAERRHRRATARALVEWHRRRWRVTRLLGERL